MTIAATAIKAAPAVIGAIGGLFGDDDEDSPLEQNMRLQQQAQKYQTLMWHKNRNLQKEFAKHGVTWQLQQYKKMGINPLAAVSGSTYRASPISVSSTGGSVPSRYPKTNKYAAFANALSGITSDRLDNELKKAQIKLVNAQADAVTTGATLPQTTHKTSRKYDTQAQIPGQAETVPRETIQDTGKVGPMENLVVSKQNGDIHFPNNMDLVSEIESDPHTSLKIQGTKFTNDLNVIVKGLKDLIVKDDEYRYFIKFMKRFISNRLGVSERFIHHVRWKNQFYLDRNGRALYYYNLRRR
jgi:hypothetical protein